ncbi:MAG: hypothetical protein ACI376_07905 [Candidatus Bruticola sp.]
MVNKKTVSSLVASLLFSLVLLLTAPVAQASGADEAAALQSFKTFIKYLQNQDGRAWNLFSARTQGLILDISVEQAINDSRVQSMMKEQSISRQQLRELIKHELADPNSEASKACWSEVRQSLPVEALAQVDYQAVLKGNIVRISVGGGSAELFTMVKENGQWKLDLADELGAMDNAVDSDDQD